MEQITRNAFSFNLEYKSLQRIEYKGLQDLLMKLCSLSKQS